MPVSEPRRSVRRRLLVLLLPAAVALMALAWFIHGLLLEQMSRDFVVGRLQDEVTFLERQLAQFDGDINAMDTGTYFEDVFHHAFAIATPDGRQVSPARWRPVLEALIDDQRQGAIDLNRADHTGDMLAYRRTMTIAGQPTVIIVAEDLNELQQTQQSLHIWTAVVSLLLVGLLVSAIWFGVTLALRPVGILQRALSDLRTGRESRIHVQAPEEFQPLVAQLNELLDTLDQRLERSRDALANLSHSLKTPIAAVKQTLEDEERDLDPDLRRTMARRLADLDHQLEAEMRRSRFAGPQAGKGAQPIKQARDLLWMLGRLYRDKRFELITQMDDGVRWPIEEQDLNEVLGNLLDNAGKWASESVELTLREHDGRYRIVVTDDGPGVEPSTLTYLGTRGLRLDEQTPGHGLGLAIVREVVERYRGSLAFANAPGGGLSAIVSFPDQRQGPAT